MKNTQPKIQFESEGLNLFAFGVSPIDRLGLEQFLDYKVISFKKFSWLEDLRDQGINILSLKELFPDIQLEKINTENAINSKEFVETILRYDNPNLLIYKTSEAIQKAATDFNINLIANDYRLTTQLENKKTFREIFENRITIPPFVIEKTKDLNEKSYAKFNERFGKFVIQDANLSGGKGTFIIDSNENYKEAVEFLKDKSGDIIISKFIEGEVTSIQVCTTKYGVISTGLQTQIVGDPALLNKQNIGKEQFSGGEWGYKTFDKEVQKQAYDIAQKIGKEIYAQGYKGIFGIDTIIDESGKLYVLEINARLTGMTPFITMLQNLDAEIPLLLLHALELSSTVYTVSDDKLMQSYFDKNRKGGYMILHNRQVKEVEVKEQIKAGVYDIQDSGELEFSHFGYNLTGIKTQDQLVIPDPPDAGTIIQAGERVLRILTLEEVLDENNKVNERYKEIINNLEKRIFKL